ncbi:hypothetical protein TrVE_jg11545 [Triparma verrucosa]|nr:hypothetical protein TrVE_jg11545 [Triparma verrucosa]
MCWRRSYVVLALCVCVSQTRSFVPLRFVTPRTLQLKLSDFDMSSEAVDAVTEGVDAVSSSSIGEGGVGSEANLPDDLSSLPKFSLPDLPDPPDLPELPELPKFDMPVLPKFDAAQLPKFDASQLGLDSSQLPQIPPLPPAVLDAVKPLAAWYSSVPHLFEVATFAPQLFWLLIIIPGISESSATKFIMKSLTVPILLSIVHLSIVYLSIIDPSSGTAPMAEFTGVFDPAGDPQSAMVGMMKYPNFVSEEWSHVLTWDLFVGRWIWLDGIKRGVFTPVSLLVTNLIGPPGLLLHILTGLVQGKGFPKDFE